ncbi:hypothetical protein DFH09DRAFT_1105755 [Mycena vulgaris]|nr:hypothetical protein DFH09DRAFT_1105755 [Mycena vulgaris]
MREALDTLIAERDGVDAYVSAHKALISPVRRLPLDIIQEIFIACMPTPPKLVMSAREAPVLLGRICSAWRAISLATPPLPLLSHLLRCIVEAKWTQRLETAKTWLSRSSQCPLLISMEGASEQWGMPPGPPLHTGLFLEALIQFAPRWQHVSFRVAPMSLETLERLTESAVPVLESLTLSPHHSNTLSHFDWAREQLSIVRISTAVGILNIPVHPGPTRVYYVPGDPEPSISSETALQIISRCPTLRSCALRLVDEFAIPSQHTIIEHQLIETLKLYCAGTAVGDTFRLLLGRLSLPQVKDVTIRMYSHGLPGHTQASDDIPPLCQFLASSTQLGTLDMDTATFSTPALIDILGSLPPSVLQLRLDDTVHLTGGWGWGEPTTASGLNDDVLEALTTAPCYFGLQSLHIQYSTTISDAGLLRFVTSMLENQARPALRRIRADFSREIEHNILPDLNLAIENGLAISITYPPPPPMYCSPWQGLPDYDVVEP